MFRCHVEVLRFQFFWSRFQGDSRYQKSRIQSRFQGGIGSTAGIGSNVLVKWIVIWKIFNHDAIESNNEPIFMNYT